MIHLQAQQIVTDENAIKVSVYLITSLLGIIALLLAFIAKFGLKTLKQLTDSFNLMQTALAVHEKRLDRNEEDIEEQKKKLHEVSFTVERHSERFTTLRDTGRA